MGLLFAIQIYCDFAGYSTIAVGTAKLFGIELTENFDALIYQRQYLNFGEDGIYHLLHGLRIIYIFPLEETGKELLGSI